MTLDFFFYGTFCHLPLLEIALGRPVRAEVAYMPDHALYCVKDGLYPLIVQEPGRRAEGVLVRGVTEAEHERLDLYDGAFGYRAQRMQVDLATGGTARAMVYYPEAENWGQGPEGPWDLAVWQARYGAEFEATMHDLIALQGKRSPRMLAARLQQMLARGAARVRAGAADVASLRLRAGPEDVAVAELREPYARFFAVEEADLQFRRFDGSMSAKVTRATFIAGDAVTVLPYDPVRDRVLVVDQFRAGPQARGDAQPWQIEAIAGRIDAGETPEVAARREAVEEAGLQLDALLPVAQYYPSPGCSSEYIYSYLALVDLPDDAVGVFGVEGEAEDIRSHLIGYERLLQLVATGEIGNAPLLLTALWLTQHRDALRGKRRNGA